MFFSISRFEIYTIDMDLWVTIHKHQKLLDQKIQKKLDDNVNGFSERNRVVYWKNRIIIPKSQELREKIIQLHHDKPIPGHPG